MPLPFCHCHHRERRERRTKNKPPALLPFRPFSFMGRARRNQREAIRKQRAKRRRKNNSSSTDDDDSCADRHRSPNESPSGIAPPPVPGEPGGHFHEIKEGGQETINSVDKDSIRESKTSSTNNNSEAAASRNTPPSPSSLPSSLAVKVGTVGKPLDRVERMRLKKQRQKARRREKKAAREAAASK